MEEIDIAVVVHRSIHGIVALVTRTLFIQIISFVVNFLLTIYLTPAIFGVYFVVTAVIAFLQYFSDIGLAAALIQKKDGVTKEDLTTTFTIQQILVISSCLVAFFASPWVARFYHLETTGLFLFEALIAAFFLSSLKTIPSILLERDLRFEKLVIPQIVETLAFNVIALILAVKGFGIASFTYAVLARGILGVIAIYFISPWKISFGISIPTAKRLLSYGIPFQANSFLALLKDDLLIAYAGKVLPLAQVGYIGFAQKWAFTPLRLIMDNVIRITFPSFSRLQHDVVHLGKAIEKSVFALAFLIFPSLVGLVFLAPSFLVVIPRYQKWEPAVISLALFAVNASFSGISAPLTNVLQAVGKIKIALYLMIFWTIATWILTPIALHMFGFNGFAGASAVISVTSVFVVILARKYVSFSMKPILVPFIGAMLLAGFLYTGSNLFAKNLLTIGMLIIGGSVLYLGVCFLLAREEMVKDINMVKRQFIK